MPVDLLAGRAEGKRFPFLDREGPRNLLEGMDPDEIARRLTPGVVPQQTKGMGERFSEGVREGADILASPVETAADLMAGIPAWAVGQVAGAGSSIGERLAGGSADDASEAWDVAAEKYGGIVQEGLSGVLGPQSPRSEYSKQATELIGRGLETGLGAVKKAANIEGDLYEPLGLRPLEETHPHAAKFGGLAAELMAFKAAHVVGGKARRAYNRWRDKVSARGWNIDPDTELDILKALVKRKEESGNWKGWNKELENLQKRLEGQRLLDAPDDFIDAEFTSEIVSRIGIDRDFKLGGTTREPSGGRIRGEAPDTIYVGPQKALPAPETKAKPPGPPLKRSVNAAGKRMGADIEFQGMYEDGIYAFKITEPGKESNFTVVSKKRPTAKEIAKAGKEVLEGYEKPEGGVEPSHKLFVPAVRGGSRVAIGRNHGEAYMELERAEINGVRDTGWYNENTKEFISDKEYFDRLKSEGVDSPKAFKEGSLQARPLKGRIVEPSVKKFDEVVEKTNKVTSIGDRISRASGERRFANDQIEDIVQLPPNMKVDPIKYSDINGLKDIKNKWEETFEKLSVEGRRKVIGADETRRTGKVPKRTLEELEDILRAERIGGEPGLKIVERKPAKIGKKEIVKEDLKPLSIEEAQAKAFEILPEAEKFIDEGIGNAVEISKRLNEIRVDINTEEGKLFKEGIDKVTGALNRAINMREATAPIERVRVTPEAVGRKVEGLKNADRLDLTPEQYESFERAREHFTKQAEGKTRSEAELDELAKEQVKDQKAETIAEDTSAETESYREAKKYDRTMDDDWNLADYGIDDMAGDLVDLFFKDERGSFSSGKMTPEQIAKLHKVWQKARDMGRNLGEYIKAAMPEVSDETVRKMEQFAEEHFVQRRSFETKDLKGEVLDRAKPKKARKVLGRVVESPPYFKKYLEGWKSSKPTKFSAAVGGKQGTNARIFFRQHPWLAEEVYYPWRKAMKVAKNRKAHVKQILRDLKSGVSKKSRRRIRDYAVAQQENGIELLKASGIDVVPKLTKAELKVYNRLREGFDRFYEEVNNMRVSIGKNPFKKVDDYFTFLRAVSEMERMGLKGELFTKNSARVMQEHARMKATPFRFAKRRGKGSYRLEDDPFKIFQTYAETAIDHIEVSPIVAKAKTILDPVKDPSMAHTTKSGKVVQDVFNPMKSRHRKTAQYLADWAHKVSGVPMGFDQAHPLAAKRLGLVNRNLGASILGGSLRSALIQPTALLNTFVEIGPYHTSRGVLDMLSPRKNRSAMLKSDVLYPRNFDATVGEMLGELRDLKVGEFPKYARAFSMKGLEWLDMLTARASWHGAYSKGRSKYNMSEAQAIRFADDVVVKTQASGAPGELAPIQYTSLGKTATMFQTFVINNWNFLVHDVVGVGSGATVGEVMPKILKYVVGAAAINALYEDLAGIKSPLPRPLNALMDSIDQDNTAIDIAIDTAKELIEPIPIVGNARYGSTPLGPAAEKLADLFEMTDKDKRRPDKALELTGNALGVPGTGQVAGSYRAYKRGESPWGIAIKRYNENDRRTRRSRSKRSSRANR